MEKAIKKCHDNIKENQKKIADERAKEDDTGERQRQQEELTRLESSVTEFSAQIFGLEESHKKTKAEGVEADKAHNAAKRRVEQLANSVKQKKDGIRDLENATTSRL